MRNTSQPLQLNIGIGVDKTYNICQEPDFILSLKQSSLPIVSSRQTDSFNHRNCDDRMRLTVKSVLYFTHITVCIDALMNVAQRKCTDRVCLLL